MNEAPKFTAPSEGDVEKTVQENARSLNIYTFQATDPERRKVYWSLSDDDAISPDTDQFTISDRGALILNASPDYEDDTGLGSDKQYTVVVVASDDAAGAGFDEDPIVTSMKTVTVTVTDKEEPGTITLTPKYPHVGDDVTATLTDGDETPSPITWKWTAGGAAVGSDSRYTPVGGENGDIGKTLRVEASYTEDGEGKVVGPVSAGRVRAAPDPPNADPEFENIPRNIARKVAENARVSRLGDPITATDAEGDTLTYTVGDDNFSINSSGQLSTAAMLDHEGEGGATRTVTITATDPWGGTGSIVVTVTVEDVNEAPMINVGLTRRDRDENTDTDTPINTYVANDVDAGDTTDDLTWSLEGEDAAKFDIVEADGMLTFKESPTTRCLRTATRTTSTR